MLTVEKKEFAFGSLNSSAGAKSPGCPGAPAKLGSWIKFPASYANLHAAYQIDDMFVDANGIPVAAQIALAHRAIGDGPVRAIAIAPDSPIHSAVVVIGGSNSAERHVISPSTPWIGDIGGAADFALIAPLAMVPGQLFASGAAITGWDCRLTTGGDGIAFGWPLRVHVYRSKEPYSPYVIGQRAPMSGVIGFDLTGATPQNHFFCVDGRQRWDVMVTNNGPGTITVSVTGYDGSLTHDANNPVIDALNTVLLDGGTVLASGGNYVRSYQGNPFFGVRVVISDGSGGPSKGTTYLHAWDF
jgi:hypothetical protein